jgi:membrane dipeptidase
MERQPYSGSKTFSVPETLFSALEAHGVARESLDGSGARLLRVLETVRAQAEPSPPGRGPFPPRDDLFLDGEGHSRKYR